MAPGIPLLSLVDLNDVWLRFDLREDLMKDIKLGTRIKVRIPALGDRDFPVESRLSRRRASMRAGGRHARPAISICALSPSALIRWRRSPACVRA